MLKITDMSFTYEKTASYILNHIDLTINRGEYVSILGDNGSGKSTMIKIILGFLKPCKGTILMDFDRIGYVPQKVEGFNTQFPLTVYEMLNCHRKILKIKDVNVIDDCLNMVKMNNFKNMLIGNLSGGQRQKIFIARSLIGNPDLIILDEPSTGIDVKSQDDIYRIIKSLNITRGITVISVEHNIEAALNNSSFIYKLHDGKGYVIKPNQFFMMKKGGNIYASI